jgi:hypothetical protein
MSQLIGNVLALSIQHVLDHKEGKEFFCVTSVCLQNIL